MMAAFVTLTTGHNYDGDPAGGKTVFIRVDTIVSVADFQNEFYRAGKEGNASESVVQEGAMILFSAGSGETNSTFVNEKAVAVMAKMAAVANR
jgi:hypothetical protein